jgi:hypothetical protein
MKTLESVSFEPETITLMQEALEEAWASIPFNTRAGLSKTLLAEGILRAAAQGERDLAHLRARALAGIATPTKATL